MSKKILIIFGSTGGNTQLVCYQIADTIKNFQLPTAKSLDCNMAAAEVKIYRAENFDQQDLADFDLIILASPTYGHGLLQDHIAALLPKLKKQNLKDQKFAIVALGDDKYDKYHHIESARILTEFVKEVGGEIVVEALRISKSPVPYLDTVVVKWAEHLMKTIQVTD